MSSEDEHRPDDWHLARRAMAGERRALDTFVQRMHCIPRILAQRNARLGRPFNEGELEDLAQEVFARLWQRLQEFRGDASLESWAYRFCAWTMLDALRSRRRAREREDNHRNSMQPREEIDHEEELELLEVHAALALLSDEESQVVRLKQFENLSFSAIAERLSLAESTVKTRYYRALLSLRERLERVIRKGAER